MPRRFPHLRVLPLLCAWPLVVATSHARDIDDATRSRLEALGYVNEVEEEETPARPTGVTLHDRARAEPGVNVYCSAERKTVHFFDNDGTERHRIHLDLSGKGPDCMIEPYDEGRVLGIRSPSIGLVRWDSKTEWRREALHHHDAAVAPNGDVYTFTQHESSRDVDGTAVSLVDQAIVVLDSEGREKRRIGFEKLFSDLVDPERLARIRALQVAKMTAQDAYVRERDVYHPNTIEWLDEPYLGAGSGSLLVCVRELDLIAVLDLRREQITWSWGPGFLDRPHHPQRLPNGNLLVFDNGYHRRWSRVVEVAPNATNPTESKVVSTYHGQPKAKFLSPMKGSAQRLGNGNLLVTESAKGRVFEVTPGGEMVWEFWNPYFSDRGKRLQIYRMFRMTEEEYAALAGGPPPAHETTDGPSASDRTAETHPGGR